MNRIYNIIKNFFNIFIMFIGLGIVIWFIWVRFIRERLPRNIPFQLNEISFYILLWICFIYFYIVYKLIRPKEPKVWILKIIDIIYLPLTTLDEAIKTNKYIYPKYKTRIFQYITYLNQLTVSQYVIICFCYNILPRLFIVSLLIIDIFIFQQLNLLYSFVILSIFPILHRYVKYSLKFTDKHFTTFLTSKYSKVKFVDLNETDPDWEYNPITMLYHDKYFTIKEYLDIQVDLWFKDDETTQIDYDIWCYCNHEVFNNYNLIKYNTTEIKITSEDLKILKKDFYFIAPILIKLKIFLRYYTLVENISWIKNIRIIIFSIYFICWAYILYISYDTVQLFPLTWSVIEYTFDNIIPSIYSIIKLLILEYNENIEPISGLWL